MTRQWPRFETAELGDTEADFDELVRRWRRYDAEMKALIAKGGVHQDEDGWWIDDASGELIGPDPEIERPRESTELERMGSFAEVSSGTTPVTLQLDTDLVEQLRASGPDWQKRINAILKKAVGL